MLIKAIPNVQHIDQRNSPMVTACVLVVFANIGAILLAVPNTLAAAIKGSAPAFSVRTTRTVVNSLVDQRWLCSETL